MRPRPWSYKKAYAFLFGIVLAAFLLGLFTGIVTSHHEDNSRYAPWVDACITGQDLCKGNFTHCKLTDTRSNIVYTAEYRCKQ